MLLTDGPNHPGFLKCTLGPSSSDSIKRLCPGTWAPIADERPARLYAARTVFAGWLSIGVGGGCAVIRSSSNHDQTPGEIYDPVKAYPGRRSAISNTKVLVTSNFGLLFANGQILAGYYGEGRAYHCGELSRGHRRGNFTNDPR